MISTAEFIAVIAASATGIAALLAVLFMYRNQREAHYNQTLQRAELELLRRSIESQIHGLNKDMVATESRWRDANHLLISSQARVDELATARRVPETRFLRAAGISAADLRIEEDLVFVITPFHPDHQNTFYTIAEICREVGLRALRGDEEYVEGDLLPHILRLIVRARLIIANVDGRNTNVFYELGIAHALDKTTILVAGTPFETPFDLRTRKLVLYQDQPDLREKLRSELTRTLVRS